MAGILIGEQDLVRVTDLPRQTKSLQLSRNAPGVGRTREADGTEFSDGGIFHHGDTAARTGGCEESGGRVGAF